MEELYKHPDSTLETELATYFSFSNLGIWRKIYLFFNWIASIGIVAALLIGVSLGETESDLNPVFIVVFCSVFLGYAYWLHSAVSKRNLTQLLVLAILQIVPLVNPIGALIIFAIRSTSKTEIGND